MALKVLSALDTARTQYYHFRAIVVAGMGLFTDAYDLFCIPPIMRLLGHVYYEGDNKVPALIHYTLVCIALLGTVIGQLVFGRLGDCIGRRRVYGIVLMLMVLSSFGCGFSVCTEPACVLVSLGFFRFLLGLGIGGDYPLSATIMSEFANKRTRGAFIASVFTMQGLGILVGSCVTMAVCKFFEAMRNRSEGGTPVEADIAWRLILMFGAVPAGLTLYWRMMMPETARYTALVEQDVLQAAKNMEKVMCISLHQIAEDEMYQPPSPPPSYPFFSMHFFRRHGRDLFSCSAAWLLVDIVFYSINLVQNQIYDHYYPKKEKDLTAYKGAYNMAKLQALVAISSTIPGYWAAIFLIDRLGRVKIQFIGFLFMGIALFIIGISYSNDLLSHRFIVFLILYGLTLFFSNFGPNTTTFIVPAELFPARFRSTCHGISGAFGKVGAIIGTIGFHWASDNINRMQIVLIVMGGVCILGMLVTYFFMLETKGRSLEENEKDSASQELYFLRCYDGRSGGSSVAEQYE